MAKLSKISPYWKPVLIILIALLSVSLKLKDLDSFVDPEAFISTADGYRYARYAIEIQNGTFGKIDYLADVPHYGINQYPPPLLSLMAAGLSNLTGIKIHYFFLILPPLLSALFVIPIYQWLKPLCNDYVTFGAVTFGLFNFYYFVRTRAGYFDTDCMIPFFLLTAVVFITLAVKDKEDAFRSYLFIVLAGLTMAILKWWYGHIIFVFVCLASLIIGLVAYRHTLKTALLMITLFIVLSGPIDVLLYLFQSPFVKDYIYGVILGIEQFKMPINAYAEISELIPLKLGMTIFLNTDNKLIIYSAIAFGVIFYAKHLRYLSPAIPILILAMMSFYKGNRYQIYLGPFIGMGFGYFLYILFQYLKRPFSVVHHRAIDMVGLFLVITLMIPSSVVQLPQKRLALDAPARDMIKLKELTEEEAYILSWWGMGNLIQYFSGRAVYVDNTYFSPHKLYIILKVLTTNDEDFAYRSIAYLTNQRSYGPLTDITTWSEKFGNYQEKPKVPVYIMLYNNVVTESAMRDNTLPNEEAIRLAKSLPMLSSICNNKLPEQYDCGQFRIDYKTGHNIAILDKSFEAEYKEVIVVDKRHKTNKAFSLGSNGDKVMHVLIAKDGSVHKIPSYETFKDTMFYKMLILSEDSFKHFELIYEDYPYMVLYKVRRCV